MVAKLGAGECETADKVEDGGRVTAVLVELEGSAVVAGVDEGTAEGGALSAVGGDGGPSELGSELGGRGCGVTSPVPREGTGVGVDTVRVTPLTVALALT